MRVEKAAGAVGAYLHEVRASDAIHDEQLFEALHAALIEHGVIFLRDQPLTPAELQQLAARFGTLEPHGAYPLAEGAEHVQVLQSTPENPSKIEVWHTDMSFRAAPPTYTLLHAQQVPEHGGDTLWSSTSAAFEALSLPMQQFIDGLLARHDFRRGFKESLAEAKSGDQVSQMVDRNPPVTHPVVRTHPKSGRKILYVNRLFTDEIVGLSRLESDGLLEVLFQQVRREEFTVRLRWAPGTLAIWDNRSTQHKPVNDYFPQRRRMHRVTVTT